MVTLALVGALAWVSVAVPLSNVLPGGHSTGQYLQQLDGALAREPDWPVIEDMLANMERAWESLEPWLEFLHEKGTVSEFRTALGRLAGAVEVQDLPAARQELRQLQVLWEDLNRL